MNKEYSKSTKKMRTVGMWKILKPDIDISPNFCTGASLVSRN